VSWAWWDWPLTWLTNHRPSVLWHCWLGHMTRKTVSEMIYNVSSGTLNSTILLWRLVAVYFRPDSLICNCCLQHYLSFVSLHCGCAEGMNKVRLDRITIRQPSLGWTSFLRVLTALGRVRWNLVCDLTSVTTLKVMALHMVVRSHFYLMWHFL